MKTMKAGLLCLAMCAAVAPKAQAQMTWTDQVFVNISGGYQAGSDTLTTNTPFELYDEQGTVTSSQKVSGGGLFDISVGYKVWRNLAAGVGFSHTGRILQRGGHRARARPARVQPAAHGDGVGKRFETLAKTSPISPRHGWFR